MKQRNIDLHIDKLVLNGFRSTDGEPIKDTVQRELSRLLVERGIYQRQEAGVNYARLEGGEIDIEPQMNVAVAGKQIARAIYRAAKR